MKEWNKEQRWELALKLEGIIGADIDLDEEEALRDAIRLICPEFAAMRDAAEEDVVGWFENTPIEEQRCFVAEEEEKARRALAEQAGMKLIFGEKKDG